MWTVCTTLVIFYVKITIKLGRGAFATYQEIPSIQLKRFFDFLLKQRSYRLAYKGKKHHESHVQDIAKPFITYLLKIIARLCKLTVQYCMQCCVKDTKQCGQCLNTITSSIVKWDIPLDVTVKPENGQRIVSDPLSGHSGLTEVCCILFFPCAQVLNAERCAKVRDRPNKCWS